MGVKLPASILLVTFMAFIAQTILLPGNCAAKRGEDQCGTCPMMAMHRACMQQYNAKKQDREKNSHQTSPKCTDCPLCTVLQYTPLHNLSSVTVYTNKEYAVAVSGNLAGYSTAQWKPPNYKFFS
ncbi:MAG TPA: hypothetical protein VG738_15520 [Chitinophagaceae bacterium]|nr:hypothetical protein [Chitinophagaceae bacterium]